MNSVMIFTVHKLLCRWSNGGVSYGQGMWHVLSFSILSDDRFKASSTQCDL